MSVAIAELPAPIGHNLPDNLQTFEAHRANVDDLYEEAKNWLDGAPIENAAQADAVEILLDMIRQAHDAADEARKVEKRPFDEGADEVQTRYHPLIGAKTKAGIGKTVRAKEACLAALTIWRNKVEAEKRAEADRLRREAEAKAAEAAEALRQASAGSDLEAREEAEGMVDAASRAAREAAQLEKGPTGLRTSWVASLTDPKAALLHYATARPEELKAFLLSLAQEDVRAGRRTIPGFDVTEQRKAL